MRCHLRTYIIIWPEEFRPHPPPPLFPLREGGRLKSHCGVLSKLLLLSSYTLSLFTCLPKGKFLKRRRGGSQEDTFGKTNATSSITQSWGLYSSSSSMSHSREFHKDEPCICHINVQKSHHTAAIYFSGLTKKLVFSAKDLQWCGLQYGGKGYFVEVLCWPLLLLQKCPIRRGSAKGRIRETQLFCGWERKTWILRFLNGLWQIWMKVFSALSSSE